MDLKRNNTFSFVLIVQYFQPFFFYHKSSIFGGYTLCPKSPGLFLTLLGTWPVELELGISQSFDQNWEFLAKYSVEICV